MSKLISSTLEQICLHEKRAIISGPFGSNISSKFFVESGIPVIRGNNLSLDYDKFFDDHFVFVTPQKADELKCYAYRNDLIFTAAGTIGQVGVIPENSRYTKYVISNKQIRARIDTKKIDLLYAYWFSSPWIRAFLIRNNKGSTVPLLTLSEIKDLPIIYPESIDEQKTIISVIDNISKKIEINKKINDYLEEQLQLLYDYWFTQFNFPDDDGQPYKASNGLMVWNENINHIIPAGWQVKPMGTICSFRNGINYNKNVEGNTTYKIINVRNISSSTLFLDESNFDEICLPRQQGDKYCVSDESIIIARSGIPGATRILCNPSSNIIFCGFIICCTPYNNTLQNYLTLYLKQFEGSSATQTGGSILKNVSQETLKNLLVPIPPQSLLNQFNDSVSHIYNLIIGNIKENVQLTTLRDWLLPMLMNGQATIED